MLAFLTIISLLASGGTYLAISWRLHRRAKHLDDVLPIASGGTLARVLSTQEFNAATVAPTISLATVILAFTELAPYMGAWLLWTVVTTALGILVVRIFARKIWARLSEWKTEKPTLHGFLGGAFGSPMLKTVAAFCTSLGFLGAFAVELTVGTKFLAALVPALPGWLAVLLLAGLGVGYTVLGGFRAVVVTDRIQMWAIWGTIIAIFVVIWTQIAPVGGVQHLIHLTPKSVYDFSWRDGLTAFLIGIFVINVPTFLSDMSVWQRISATHDEKIVTKGLLGSVLTATVSWGALAVIACALVGLVPEVANINPLFTFLKNLGSMQNPAYLVAFVVIVTGLYAASLSTASTQLIATAHTIHTDLLGLSPNHESRREIVPVRIILFVGAAVSVGIVLLLTEAGFSIADLVFAIYGAQLSLVPAVMLALFGDKARLPRLKSWAGFAIGFGFISGWVSAAVGTIYQYDNLTFLAPAVSLFVAWIVLWFGTRVIGNNGPMVAVK